ncbi:unnamed protein product [Prorocentrum cordatum]|uniref:Non-specific serine/threonine protein kinase n=1 Tax=Prorocentrum cordatum TaxID=2364126 RepID=A0ABN9X162_9DINO|nr:unnamed protein product [Polarella glacialis]
MAPCAPAAGGGAPAADPGGPAEQEQAEGGIDASRIRQMFDHFDRSGEGFLTLAQFKAALHTMGMDRVFSESDMDTIVMVADYNGDRKIDFQEFVAFTTRMLSSGAQEGEEEECGSNVVSGKLQASATPRTPSKGSLSDGEGGAAERGLSVEANLRRQLIEARERAERAEESLAQAQRSAEAALKRAKEAAGDAALQAERQFEEEMEASTTFWCDIARTSATPRLSQCLDLDAAELLGNGKYGFVFRSQRSDDGQPVVVKLLGLRWAHVAAKEWGRARDIGEHPNLVRYSEVMLHADDDKVILNLLSTAQRQGRLQNRVKRQSFPDRYICFMQEFMNRGTVQDWMDKHILLPGGLFATLRCVAGALAHMHSCGVTHNDIKPENVMLKQEEGAGPRADVTAKLGDFGLAVRSKDRSTDFAQLGMTVLCMVTGEHFGSRKFAPELVDRLVAEVAAVVRDAVADEKPSEGGRSVGLALAQLPRLLRQIWAGEVDMKDVRDLPALRGWGFSDGECLPPGPSGGYPGAADGAGGTECARAAEVPPLTARSLDGGKVLETALLSARRVRASVEAASDAAPGHRGAPPRAGAAAEPPEGAGSEAPTSKRGSKSSTSSAPTGKRGSKSSSFSVPVSPEAQQAAMRAHLQSMVQR